MMELINIAIAKPSVGMFGSFAGGLSGLAGWAGLITPILACIGAMIGIGIGFLHLRIVYKRWRKFKDIEQLFCERAECARRQKLKDEETE